MIIELCIKYDGKVRLKPEFKISQQVASQLEYGQAIEGNRGTHFGGGSVEARISALPGNDGRRQASVGRVGFHFFTK